MSGEESIRCSDQSPLLVRIDGAFRCAEFISGTKAYLDENACVAVAHDEIDLAVAHAVVAHDQNQTAAPQVPKRTPLGTTSRLCVRTPAPRSASQATHRHG